MPSSIAERLKSPAGRTSLFYLTALMPFGVALPYFSIWLTDKGLSPEQIGAISATPILLTILFNMLVGRIADRASDWRSIIIVGLVAGALTPALLFFVDDFWTLIVVWALVMVPAMLVMPVADAAAARMARRVGGEFAHIRLWGTVGFILMAVITGPLIGWFGAAIFLVLFLAVAVLRALLALQLPLFRSVERPIVGDARGGVSETLNPMVATRMRQAWRPWFLLPLIGVALLHGGHMLQANFGALIWRDAGVPPAIIGPLWALSPVGELIVMLFFHRLAKRFSARHLIAAACAFSVLRWIGMAMQPSIPVLAVLQLMNMLTFGLSYLGAISFIANWTSEDIAAEAQSFSVVLRQVVTVLCLPVFGYLVARWGAQAFYASMPLSVAGGLLVLWSLRLLSPKSEGSSAEPTTA